MSYWQGKRTLVTGATGFVGRNLTPLLEQAGAELIAPSRSEYNLLEQADVRRLMADTRPDVVFHLAALSGGILANRDYPADFSYQNLMMNTMVAHEAWRARVGKFVTLIGGCSYPAHAVNPIREADLWNGTLRKKAPPTRSPSA